jgi:TolA-binding protein
MLIPFKVKNPTKRFPTDPDTETALFRMAKCAWTAHRDAQTARACLSEMVKRFPRGEMTPYGRTLWQQIEQSTGQAR